jgi:hypothetical protein
MPHSNTILRAYLAWQPMRNFNKIPDWLEKEFKMPGNDNELTSNSYVLPNSFIYLIRCPMPLGGKSFVPLHEQSKYAILQSLKGNQQEIEALKEKQKLKFHATDRPLMISETTKLFPHSFEYLKPPDEYLCSSCNKLGHHYKEACFIWPKTFSDGELACGSKKFGTAVQPNEEDAKHFSILHKMNL